MTLSLLLVFITVLLISSVYPRFYVKYGYYLANRGNTETNCFRQFWMIDNVAHNIKLRKFVKPKYTVISKQCYYL